MDYTDRFDGVRFVIRKTLGDGCGIHALSPVARDKFRLQSKALSESLPEGGEVAGFGHQNMVSG